MRKQDLTAVDRFPDGLFFMRCKEKDMTIDVNNGGMLVNSNGRSFRALFSLTNALSFYDHDYTLSLHGQRMTPTWSFGLR